MQKLRSTAVGLGLLAAVILGAGAAAAEPAVQGYTTASINLRAGPSTSYPAVAAVRAGDEVTIYGCLSGWTWCDIDWRGYRGWAAGQYLEVAYRQHHQPILSYGQDVGVPFLSFSIGSYWNDHYRERTFFSDMQRYQGADVGQKPSAEKNQQPQVQKPQAQQPKIQQPKNQQPKVQKPQGQQPQAQQPKNQQPKGQQLKGQKPNAGQPQGQKCGPGQTLVNGACQ